MICAVRNCGAEAAPNRRRCRRHLDEDAAGRRRRRAATPPGACQVESCTNAATSRTLCDYHREIARRRAKDARAGVGRMGRDDEALWLSGAL